MVDIANMRPSMLRTLHENLADADYAEEFLASLAMYLASAAPDGGVDTDRLYVVGVQLSNANAWDHLKPVDVMRRAGHISSETLLTFTAGMPDAVARSFLETRLREAAE
ncbi:MAG: hypothetical protein QE484_19505 [Rhizobium sp.]|nr:hypothetical protein [Rhizobium sp.]